MTRNVEFMKNLFLVFSNKLTQDLSSEKKMTFDSFKMLKNPDESFQRHFFKSEKEGE